jgi:hypothetical protein
MGRQIHAIELTSPLGCAVAGGSQILKLYGECVIGAIICNCIAFSF